MKKILILCFVILIFVIFYFFIVFASKEKTNSNSKSVEKEKSIVNTLSLAMVGDALIHSSVYKDAYKNGVYNFENQLEFIKPIIKNYDLAFYNQETILGGKEIGLSDYPLFNSPWEFGDAMIDAGFNIVNLATNHTLDRGEKGVLKSCEYWDQKDVLSAGSYCSYEEAERVKIYEKNGISYTLLSYTYGTNGINVPEGKEYLVNIYDEEKVKRDVEKVRDKVDLLLVSMHWGVEYTNQPTEEQKNQAQYLADLGVDVVIGTHPHVIQPITYIDDTLVIYSLGNFISAQATSNDYNSMIELMATVDVKKTTNSDGVRIELENLSGELLYNYYKKGSRWYDFKVIPFSQMNENYNGEYKRLYEKYSEIVKMYNDDVVVKSLS